MLLAAGFVPTGAWYMLLQGPFAAFDGDFFNLRALALPVGSLGLGFSTTAGVCLRLGVFEQRRGPVQGPFTAVDDDFFNLMVLVCLWAHCGWALSTTAFSGLGCPSTSGIAGTGLSRLQLGVACD